MKLVPVHKVAEARERLRYQREERDPKNGFTDPEDALFTMADLEANYVEALGKCARLIESMRNSKKINWTFEQQHSLEEHYGLAMQALAIGEGRL